MEGQARRDCGPERWGNSVSIYAKQINDFIISCDHLLRSDVIASDLSVSEARIIQFYQSMLAEKFPTLIPDPQLKASEQYDFSTRITLPSEGIVETES